AQPARCVAWQDGERQRVGKGLYARKDYIPSPSPPRRKIKRARRSKQGRQSFAPVPDSPIATDRTTDSQSKISMFIHVRGGPPESMFPAFHGGNTGSIPVGRASEINRLGRPP